MYRIRFHFGRGENFMKWQIKNTETDTVSYVNPSENQIAMMNATLKVQPSTAKKIHEGACKTVCAWIQCEAVQILPAHIKVNDHDYRIQFNPKESPHWTDGQNILDGETYDLIITNGRELYSVKTDHENDDTTRS